MTMDAKPKAAKAAKPKADAPVSAVAVEQFDLIGADGRRIVRWVAEAECRELQKRLAGEKTEIVPSAPRPFTVASDAVSGVKQKEPDADAS